jgi:hypothetical protein
VVAPFAAVAATYFLGHHQVEVDPYLGYVWPGKVDFADTTTQLRNEGIFGVKSSAFLTDNFQVEGNFAYMSHFEGTSVPTILDQTFGIQPKSVQGLIYDLNGVWNFANRPILGAFFGPYVTGGIGGLSTEVRDGSVAVIGGQFYGINPLTRSVVFDPTKTVVVHDNTAFLSLNYGGGIKSLKTWGPMGFLADFRGRTFPNFRGKSMTWPELTAGLTFTFGEK